MFSEFNSELSNYGEISKGFNFFTNKEKTYPNSAQDYANKNGGKEGFVFDVYLKIENPLHLKYSGHQYYTPIDYYDTNFKEIKKQYNSGDYDGIIIENTDKNIDDSILYAVKNSEQIKSVGNQGIFDENNPNIYYQKNNNIPVEIAKKYDFIYNKITGEKIDIVLNENIKNDNIKPQKLSAKLPFEISKKSSENKKSLIKALKLNDGKTIVAVNENTNQSGVISKNTIEKSISNLYKQDIDYKDKITILYNTKKLCESAELILSHKDVKQDTSLLIKRFANIANVNGKDYLVEIVGKDTGELSIYSINPVNTKNDGNQKRLDKSQQLDTVNNSITHIQDLFKSKLISKYNNDYKNLQQKSNIYFQPAYHGTPHKFDEFSTENIGTGEGAQAHGWGLYFAEDKENIINDYLIAGYNIKEISDKLAELYEKVNEADVEGNRELICLNFRV